MKARIDMQAWVRVSWLFSTFVLGLGVCGVWWPASQELSARHAHALELYDEANSIDAATRRAFELQQAQQRVATDIAELGGVRSNGAVTAAVLQLLHEESKRQVVQIREVAPEISAHVASAMNGGDLAAGHSDALSGSDVAISVRGTFRNIVALVADLPRHDVLIDAHDIQLASTEGDRKPPVLDVTLHSTIYRLVALPAMERSSVRSFR